ncbi:phage terminase large subunit [uncultured Desulfovibrio sp.]|uniref:phage terminase large subunit n=1 Tax=uncultured Desulfovibrio sp. TaxID=167968 RepID=UPI00261570B3|nr:phage terminase large subunit [uncultured Desulfovibrio sp.]
MAKTLNADKFRAELAALAAGLRRAIEADCTAFPVDATASAKRRRRAQHDFPFFRRTYFPHYTRRKDGTPTGDSALHLWLDGALPAAVDAPEGVKLACAAPRGEAKTTFVDVFFLVWCVVTDRKRYILIIADAFEQAASFLEAVKVELESNPRLTTDYPAHCGEGRVWNVGTVITARNIKIQAFGAGKRMRGLRHGPHRPDLALLDDLENDENVRSPEQRDKLENWLLRTVLSLGPADDSMDVIYIGTILHYDSVLARTLKKPQWRGKTFRAVERMPDRLDLWELWERIYKVPPDGPDRARAFYAGNREKMDAGAVVSWPTFRPLYTLMCKRAENRAAFDAEQQNDPLVGDAAPFAAVMAYWTELPPGLLYFGACDPSLGKAGQGRDPSALLVGGLDRENMRLYEVKADIRKRHPDRIIQDLIALQRRWGCLMWAVEAVQFQEFFADVLVREAARQGLPLPVTPLKNNTDKLLRIESLHPYFCQGRILLNPDSHTLIDQLRHFPMADHDDGPDALEMLWRTASRGFISLRDAFVRTPRGGFCAIHDLDDEQDEGGWI